MARKQPGNLMAPLVEIQALTKHFVLGRNQVVHAVDEFSLEISPREIVGLVGESGSGKSTLGKTIVGLEEKTKGKVLFKGEILPQRYTPRDFQQYSSSMQMIFQDPYSSLNPRMTVGEILGEGLRLHKSLSTPKISEKVTDWLTRVGLASDHMSRYPHEFSGGQRQRIGIARALILEPEFIVCDEPISALDVSVQAQVINLLGELKASLGLTMLFIAHDLSMVRYVSDRIAVMYLGSLIELGSADQVFFHPKHPYTDMLVRSNPEPDPVSERNRSAKAIRGEVPSPVNVQPGCRFVTRCPKAMDVCHNTTPILKTVTDSPNANRLVACHLY